MDRKASPPRSMLVPVKIDPFLEREESLLYMESEHKPSLQRVDVGGILVWTDERLRRAGVRVAFSERTGGTSMTPYASLNLGGHVGDDPSRVDRNRDLLLSALALEQTRHRLTTAEQVHGEVVSIVDEAAAGSGARVAGGEGRPPVPSADALVTCRRRLPLLMMYADCVPVVLVSVAERPAVAVVHAGWRGALCGIAGKAAGVLASTAEVDAGRLLAYVGPYIGGDDYEVSEELHDAFTARYPSAGSGGRRIDLGRAAVESMEASGVRPDRIAYVGASTAAATDRFFSYRAEGTTGRHGALAVLE